MAAFINEREKLYMLIISQLRYDGYEQIAMNLTQEVRPKAPCPPCSHLLQITNMVTKNKPEESQDIDSVKLPGLTPTIEGGKGIDLECQQQKSSKAPEIGMYETYYVTAHKGPCRTACFSEDGKLIATGSADASIKVLDVDRMIVKTTMPSSQDHSGSTGMESHPVIRTLYDHIDEVTALEFHPLAPVLISGSRDYTIKFFDISKPSVKKAYRSIQEVEQITSMSFHPSGDYILVGTEHPTIRLYEVNTLQCFVASNPREYHTGPITMVKYSPSGHLYASSSKDGSIKVWDGVSNRCISTFPNAHNGSEVSSVRFSKNSKYLLSNGKDSLVFLWELSTGRAVSMYTGVKTTAPHSVGVSFNHTEDYIFLPDNIEKNGIISLSCWDTRTTEKLKNLPSGHNNTIGCVKHSPTAAAFVSCSDDYRARFWYSEGI